MRARPHLFAISVAIAGLCCEPAQTRALPLPEIDPRRCKPAPGTTGSPGTIEEAVALANGLPFPVTAACFVEALDRPLRMEATDSQSSVQPAAGERSPRLFLWPTEDLVMAVAVDGPGRDLIEFGQFVAPRRSIKGEIAFPLEAPISTTAPLERVRNPEYPRITTCFVCHDGEEDEPSVPRGRSSVAIRPQPSSLVDVATLAGELQGCDPSTEKARCELLHALLDHGPVEHRPFDPGLPVF